MTRSWTDPRTGKRWHIDVVRGTSHGGRGAPGRGGANEAVSALVFDNGDASFSLPSNEAARLEALEDDRLAELLDRAREGGGQGPQADLRDAEGKRSEAGGTRTRGTGEASPSAAGRESQPHRDPATEAE